MRMTRDEAIAMYDRLWKGATEKEFADYIWNPDNILKCSTCPYNMGADGHQSEYPCGQWHCNICWHGQE